MKKKGKVEAYGIYTLSTASPHQDSDIFLLSPLFM